jgi:hypothetical protein
MNIGLFGSGEVVTETELLSRRVDDYKTPMDLLSACRNMLALDRTHVDSTYSNKCKLLLREYVNEFAAQGKLMGVGLWGHGEQHTRFLVSETRLLFLAESLGVADHELVRVSIKRWIVLHKETRIGLWIYHDSLELYNYVEYPYHKEINRCYNNVDSTYCLNTHIDAIVCLQQYVDIYGYDLCYVDKLRQMKQSLANVLSTVCENKDVLYGGLIKLYCFLYARRRAKWARLLLGRVVRLLKRTMKRVIVRNGRSLIHANGYIERDVAIVNIAVGYHAVNIYDISRMLLYISLNGDEEGDKYLTLLRNAIDYIVRTPYLECFLSMRETKGNILILLDAVLLFLFLIREKNWNRKPAEKVYWSIKAMQVISPIILGWDPHIKVTEMWQSDEGDVYLVNDYELLVRRANNGE